MKKMLPGIGVFATTSNIKSIVSILKSCGFNVVALWGKTKDEADKLADDLHIPFTTNKVEEILLHKDVDLVLISCPPHLQSPIAVKALGIGKHVLCGTPSGPTQVEAVRMVHAAGYYPKLISRMIYGLRFLPTITRMKQYIDDGYIGDVIICEIKVHFGNYLREKFDWTCDEMMGGGVLNTIGSNVIDIIMFLTSQKVVRVNGMLKTYTKQTEKIKGIREITSDDFCSFQMDLDKGACVTATINSNMPGNFIHEITVVGTKARLMARGADLYGHKNESMREELLHFDPINFKEEERYGISERNRVEIPTPYLKGIIRMMEAVKEAFEKEQERQYYRQDPITNAASFEDCLYVQTVIDAIRKSDKVKEWVKIKIIKEEPEPNGLLSVSSKRSAFPLQ
ncbi:hypothetical protein ACJMK2_010668 [Sinanodonta woodiana]|uniref:Glucose-fructose oxidoreductase domain-containing protein 1 n=1 Tax=Sinanodonta woodiana TaxID=1069815 RepID=A0ABD3VG33_SINWO